MRRALLSGCTLLFLAGHPGGGLAQDPVPLYPENYRVLHENDRVRVLDFRLARGAREQAHSHPAHVVYVITGFKIRFTLPNGETTMRETRDGDVLFSEAVTHASENVGDTDAHGILVELKALRALPGASATNSGPRPAGGLPAARSAPRTPPSSRSAP
jgi:quercetin dioxygenase-like cupin family protein